MHKIQGNRHLGKKFMNEEILILRIILRKCVFSKKILRIREILRVRIFVNTDPGDFSQLRKIESFIPWC